MDINRQCEWGSAHTAERAGRAKIIATQLNSTERMYLCHHQGIEYSYSTIFAGIDPALLPDLLALASLEHGHTELYCLLVATAHDLIPLVDKESMMEAAIANNTARINELARQTPALAAVNSSIKRRLEALRSSHPQGEKECAAVGEMDNAIVCGRKRRRSASL